MHTELMGTDDDKNNIDYDLPHPTSHPLPPGTVENGKSRASTSHTRQPQEPRAKLQVIKNKDQDRNNNNISADGLTLPTTPSPPTSTVEEEGVLQPPEEQVSRTSKVP